MKLNKKYLGFTLLELMITIIIASIVMLGLGAALADGHRGFNQMYARVNSAVVQDAYASRRAFDAVARKSTIKQYGLALDNTWIKLYYFSDPLDTSITEPDRSATFAASGNLLTVTYHNEKTNSQISLQTLATTVQNAWFNMPNVCAQMQLQLGDTKQSMIVTCSSIRHNEE